MQTLIERKHKILNDLHRFLMQVHAKTNEDATSFSKSSFILLASLGKCLDAISLKYGLPDMRHAQPANMYGDAYDIF